METTGKEFAEFWGMARRRGLMNPNTASAFTATVHKVLEVVDDWESRDVRQLDVEETVQRFSNLRGRDYSPETLASYTRRFKLALASFLDHADNPTKWKAPGQSAAALKARADKPASAKGKTNTKPSGGDGPADGDAGGPTVPMLENSVRLRENCIVRLRLPADLKLAEVEKLARVMRTLAVDDEPSQQ